MRKDYFELCNKLSKKALKKSEVPVGAIIVKDNKILSKGYNKRQKKKNVMNHAEIIAIKKASKKLKDWRLNDCELYVNLKPCEMCEKIINASRIKKVYYLVDKSEQKKEYKKTEYIDQKEYKKEREEFLNIMSYFFKNKR